MGVRLSPSPIYYIVVIVKKDHLCVAQVIFSHLWQRRPEAALHLAAHISGRGGGGCRVGRRTTKQYMIHTEQIEVDSKVLL